MSRRVPHRVRIITKRATTKRATTMRHAARMMSHRRRRMRMASLIPRNMIILSALVICMSRSPITISDPMAHRVMSRSTRRVSCHSLPIGNWRLWMPRVIERPSLGLPRVRRVWNCARSMSSSCWCNQNTHLRGTHSLVRLSRVRGWTIHFVLDATHGLPRFHSRLTTLMNPLCGDVLAFPRWW